MGKNIYMWAALALVLLAACQKTPQSGQVVRFTAVSKAEPVTKTGYTGVKDGTKERIDWKTGDAIRIYSDRATASNVNTYKWADYTVSGSPIASEATSTADISVTSAQGGLTWIDDAAHAFYAIYPSPGGDDSGIKGTSVSPFEGTIPAAQVGTKVEGLTPIESGCLTSVYYPPMNNAYMVAFKSLSNSGSKAYLDFEPAYTAFHICAGRKDTDITLKSVELSSVSSALTGGFTMYADGGTWNYPTVAHDPGNNDKITFTFSEGDIVLDSSNPQVEFVLFALPQNLSGLTLKFNVEIGGETKYRTLELKYIAGNTWIDFSARHKALLKGLLIPGATWTVDDSTPVVLRESVAPWDDNAQNPNYGTDLVVNASGLDEVNLSTHSYRFSIYEPEGKTWKIKVLNSSGAVVRGVTITRDNPPTGTTDPTSDEGELTGTIRKGIATAPGLIEFSLSGSTGGSNCTLSFSVITDKDTANEREYSINSEVVRGTWGSGYQYINLP